MHLEPRQRSRELGKISSRAVIRVLIGFNSSSFTLQHPVSRQLMRSCNVKCDESRNYEDAKLYIAQHGDVDVAFSRYHFVIISILLKVIYLSSNVIVIFPLLNIFYSHLSFWSHQYAILIPNFSLVHKIFFGSILIIINDLNLVCWRLFFICYTLFLNIMFYYDSQLIFY